MIDCGGCQPGVECTSGSCCKTECGPDDCGEVSDGCGGTLLCPEPDICGRCEDGRYLADPQAPIGCELPDGQWLLQQTWGPSMGTCQLDVELPYSVVDIQDRFWDDPVPSGCTGYRGVCDDGCTLEWGQTCPGVGADIQERSTQRLVNPDRIEGTFTVTHLRHDGLECSRVANIVLTRLQPENGDAGSFDGGSLDAGLGDARSSDAQP